NCVVYVPLFICSIFVSYKGKYKYSFSVFMLHGRMSDTPSPYQNILSHTAIVVLKEQIRETLYLKLK
ncbi:hypothetical protein M121_4547, partial [Bacteroides fragilis str. 3783N2-1]